MDYSDHEVEIEVEVVVIERLGREREAGSCDDTLKECESSVSSCSLESPEGTQLSLIDGFKSWEIYMVGDYSLKRRDMHVESR